MAYTQAQLIAAYTAANNGVAPDAATTTLLGAFAAQNQAGQLTDSAVLAYVINSAQDDVQVAVTAYQFFTGKIPTKAGLDFLTNSATNTTDLNDPYYAQFNIENRYINFAANLGINGEGAANFATNYGALSFNQFVGVVYEQIIGSSYAQAAGVNVSAAIADIISRQANFTNTALARGIITATSTAAQRDLATKAAVVGYLMAEGVKADVGIYAAGANNFVNSLISGTAQYGVSLTSVYSPLGGGVGSAVVNGGASGNGQLTVNPETLSGNVFNAPQGYTPGGNDLVNTLQNDDFLTGIGNDPTLNVTLGNPNDNGVNLITPTLRGVETINARFDATGLAGTGMILDLQDTSGTPVNGGVDTINITRIASGQNATVQNIAESVATTLSVSNTQSPAGVVTFSYLATALAGAADKGTVTLSNVNIGTLVIQENIGTVLTVVPDEGFETLTVNSVGSTNKVGALFIEDVQTLNITGDKNLTLGTTSTTNGSAGFNPGIVTPEATRYGAGLANVNGSLSKIDATGFKGNLDITLGTEFNAGKDNTSGLNIQLSVIGGDGNDTFRLTDAIVSGATGNVDTINGGAGTNTVVVIGNTSIGAAGTVATPIANVTNIQALEVRTGHDDAVGGGAEAADTVNINADAFDKLATIYIRNEGQSTAGTSVAPWGAAPEGMTVNLTNLTAAQATGITIAHGTTGNSSLGNNLVLANLKTATGAADAAQVTIIDGINSDPVFNFALTTTGTERVTFVDSDTESNSVWLAQGGFAAAATATAPAQAGSSLTLTGGAAGQYFNLDTSSAGLASGQPTATTQAPGYNQGYGYATNGQVGSSTGFAATANPVAAAGGPINLPQPATATTAYATTAALGSRDTLVANALGDATTNYRSVLFGAGQAGGATEAQATRYGGENLVAGAYLGDVVIRLGDVTKADGVSSQSLVTGVGNDTFIFDDLSNTRAGFTSGDTITAGTGTDTLVLDGNTALTPGTPRIDTQTSEWDNLKGIDVLRFAGNQGVANGFGFVNGVVQNTGGGYYAAIDNDFISQTDAGNRLVIINNDGDVNVNSESDVVVDLRGLSQSKWVTFIGANSVAGSTGLAHASSRLVVDDISANSNMILNGGDTNITTSATIASANNSVYEVRNTANVSINDLAQTSNFGRIEFTNDSAVSQVLTLALNNNVFEALVDSSRAATALLTETLFITAFDNAVVPASLSALNVDARSVTGFHSLNILAGAGASNDVVYANSNLGGSAHTIALGNGTADRVNWYGAFETATIGAGTTTFTGSGGTTTITHTVTGVEIQDFTGATSATPFTIVGSTGAEVIIGTAGTDVISNQPSGTANQAGGGDTITGGTGADTFILRGDVASGATPALYAAAANVTDFNVNVVAGPPVLGPEVLALSATAGNYSGVSAFYAGVATAAAGATGIQSVAQNAAAAAITAGTDLIKLTTGVATGATLQATFNAAIGTGTVTGLVAGNDIFFSYYDTTVGRAVVGVVDATNGTNTVIETGDTVTLIGSLTMSATDYGNFTAANLAIIAA